MSQCRELCVLTHRNISESSVVVDDWLVDLMVDMTSSMLLTVVVQMADRPIAVGHVLGVRRRDDGSSRRRTGEEVKVINSVISWCCSCSCPTSNYVAGTALEVRIGHADPPQWLLKAHNLEHVGTGESCTKMITKSITNTSYPSDGTEACASVPAGIIFSPVCTHTQTREYTGILAKSLKQERYKH